MISQSNRPKTALSKLLNNDCRSETGNPTSFTRSYIGSLLQHLIYANSRRIIWLRRLIVIYFPAVGLFNIIFAAQSLHKPYVYQKDFIQEYLIAKATLAGISPYHPLPYLAQYFLGPLPKPIFPHPTPHPPPVAIIAWPLGLMTYPKAAIAWFLFELTCILWSLCILLKWSTNTIRARVLIFLLPAIFTWNPFWEELVYGQLMSLLLLLLLLTWQALRSNQFICGGILLGIAVSP